MKKNKIGIIIGATILNIPISIGISLLIHCKLKNIEFNLNVLKEIALDKNYLLLFLLCYILLETIIIAFLTMNRRNSFESSVNKITNKIETPVAIGQRTTRNS